ncbi:MAG TPA: hypothetical protein VEA60_02590 [Allosphingosinicella sp.]|nr:hypothetical protein [Allosphingosinicella sp.]
MAEPGWQDNLSDFDPSRILNGRMFLGTLDDSVSRYPWTMARADAHTLSATLIYHALLGPRLCSRLGNLLYHKPYLDACLGSATPLAGMCRSGFFEIHTRANGFNETIGARLDEGTNSTEAFVAERDWKRGSAIYRQIDEFERQITARGRQCYRPEFRDAFRHFIDLAAPHGNAEFKMIYRLWERECPGLARTRSNFERICEREFPGDGGRARRAAAMSLINAANHYAYGAGMVSLARESHEHPYVDTLLEPALAEFVTSPIHDTHQPISGEKLAEIAAQRAFDVVQTELIVPLDLFRSPELWDRFTPLLDVDRATAAARQFHKLKAGVLAQLQRVIEADSVSKEKELLRQRCREYSSFIRSQLKTGSGSRFAAIAAIFRSERVKRAGEALGEEGVGEAIGKAAEMVVGAPVTGIKLAAQLALAVTKTDFENPVRKWKDRRWSRGVSTRDYYSHYDRPFRRILSVRSIDEKAVARFLHPRPQ